MTACPSCDVAVDASEQFCEACGATLSPSVAATAAAMAGEAPPALAGAADLTGIASECPACEGEVSADGYCDTCGVRAPRRRDHFSEEPAAWVAAVCDRGVRHTRNEDAVALAADVEPGSRAVLVVCDGVSSSVDSDLASLAAARAARDVLASARPRGLGTGPSLVAALVTCLQRATDAANEAVLAVTRQARACAPAGGFTTGDSPTASSPASCTFVAAMVEQHLLVVGSVGDSRAYWLPDVGEATALTLDDSFSQLQIASGVPRAEAESGPHAHAITRWLGEDAPDHQPATATMTLVVPGWLCVCSDGLWNYCSAAEDLAALVRQTSASLAAIRPLTLAGALVDWANAQGGQDNVTVALARIHPGPRSSEPASHEPASNRADRVGCV